MIYHYSDLKDIYCCFSQAPPLTVIIGAKCSNEIVLVADRKFTALDGYIIINHRIIN